MRMPSGTSCAGICSRMQNREGITCAFLVLIIRDRLKADAVSGRVPHLPELIHDGRILIRNLFYGGNGEELIE